MRCLHSQQVFLFRSKGFPVVNQELKTYLAKIYLPKTSDNYSNEKATFFPLCRRVLDVDNHLNHWLNNDGWRHSWISKQDSWKQGVSWQRDSGHETPSSDVDSNISNQQPNTCFARFLVLLSLLCHIAPLPHCWKVMAKKRKGKKKVRHSYIAAWQFLSLLHPYRM